MKQLIQQQRLNIELIKKASDTVEQQEATEEMDKFLISISNWVGINIDQSEILGGCESVCRKVKKQFPTVSIRKGFFLSIFWGRRQHWWLKYGEIIIDPTGPQYPDGLIFPSTDEQYVDLTNLSESDLLNAVPTGVCAECGGSVYHSRNFCDDRCSELFMIQLTIYDR